MSDDFRKRLTDNANDFDGIVSDMIARQNKLQNIIQMCFEDSCRPDGKLTKKTVLELMKYADTRA